MKLPAEGEERRGKKLGGSTPSARAARLFESVSQVSSATTAPNGRPDGCQRAGAGARGVNFKAAPHARPGAAGSGSAPPPPASAATPPQLPARAGGGGCSRTAGTRRPLTRPSRAPGAAASSGAAARPAAGRAAGAASLPGSRRTAPPPRGGTSVGSGTAARFHLKQPGSPPPPSPPPPPPPGSLSRSSPPPAAPIRSPPAANQTWCPRLRRLSPTPLSLPKTAKAPSPPTLISSPRRDGAGRGEDGTGRRFGGLSSSGSNTEET